MHACVYLCYAIPFHAMDKLTVQQNREYENTSSQIERVHEREMKNDRVAEGRRSTKKWSTVLNNSLLYVF